MASAVNIFFSAVSFFTVPPGLNRNLALAFNILESGKYLSQAVKSDWENLWVLNAVVSTRLSATPLTLWINANYPKDKILTLQQSPQRVLVQIQFANLIKKVAIVAAYYITSDISLYISVKNLISHSSKVSYIALPILNRIASLPVPPILFSARVVIIAPIIIQVIQSCLAYYRYYKPLKNEILDIVEKSIAALNHGVEFLLTLRYTVLYLSLSQTLFKSIISTVFSIIIYRFYLLPDSILNQLKNILFQLLLNFLLQADRNPTIGFENGILSLQEHISSLQEQHSLDELRGLAYEISGIKFDTSTPLENQLQAVAKAAEKAVKNIQQARHQKLISAQWASMLQKTLHDKLYGILKNLLLDSKFKKHLSNNNIVQELKKIYETPIFNLHSEPFEWNDFMTCLKTVTEFQLDFNQEKPPAILPKDLKITSQQTLFFNEILFEKMESFYETKVRPILANFDFWKSDKIKNNDKKATYLNAIYGKLSLMEQIPVYKGKSFLISHELMSALFKKDLVMYLEQINNHQLTTPTIISGLERQIFLGAVRRDEIFDLKWESLIEVPAFISFLQTKSINPNTVLAKNQKHWINRFIAEDKTFDYLRHTVEGIFDNEKHFPQLTSFLKDTPWYTPSKSS